MRRVAVVAAVLGLVAGSGLVYGWAGRAGTTVAPQATGTPLRDGAGLYPRAVRLAHAGAANGTVVASVVTFAQSGGLGTIYQSHDGGRTFAQVGAVTDPAAAGGLCCSSLYELPRQVGALPAGTLLWTASVGADATDRRMRIQVWRSGDQGRTWSFLSTVAVAGSTLGLWEPELAVAADGRLVAYFSDETDQPAHSQKLVEVTSTDGLAWSARTNVVAGSDPAARPGMAVVRPLSGGRYFMTYEVCGAGNGCAARWRISSDGVSWGTPTDLGRRIQTVDGRYFAHAPTVAWYDNGTPQGRLVIVGQMVYESNGSVSTVNGNTVLVNTESGGGYWYELPAPVAVPNPTNNYCPNYSSALLPSVDGGQLLEIATDPSADGSTCRPYYATGSLLGTGTSAGVTSGASYRLVSVMSGRCLEVSADSRADGGNIQQGTCDNLNQQNFTVTTDATGAFTLTGRNSQLCVGVDGSSTTAGANVAQHRCDGGAAEAWRVVNVGRGYYTLVNRNSDLCLDVAAGSTADGANVEQWTCNNLSPQIWHLEPR
jgi:hypothetical protein